jgi:uncharacterized RDD family membrane protein YckC
MKKKPLQNANALERFLANLIDGLILFIPLKLITAPLANDGLAMLVGCLGNMAYFVWFTSSAWQASPGQRLLSIYVTHINGAKMTRLDAFERFICFILPVLPLYTTLLPFQLAFSLATFLSMAWFMPIALNEKRMGIHDYLCNTRVVVGKGDAK